MNMTAQDITPEMAVDDEPNYNFVDGETLEYHAIWKNGVVIGWLPAEEYEKLTS